MVKIGEIEVSKETIELGSMKLGDKFILKAIKEKTTSATSDKVGGLTITFEERETERQVTQKYSKSFAKVLIECMEKLGLKDTLELQNQYYEYEVQQVGRNIYPRLFPTSKA